MGINKPELLHLLSPERLGPYLLAANGVLGNALALYEHNQALSEALYIPLQNLEVGLRNSLHCMLTQEFGEGWFSSAIVRKPSHTKAILEAKAKLQRAGKTPDPGRVVAELSFGFWTGFFDACYDQSLWHRHLRSVFTGASSSQPLTRKLFSGRLEAIRRLRNRVFHHEPILRIAQLAHTHQDIQFIMEMLGRDLQAWNVIHDRFPMVMERSVHSNWV
jgi:hypothetical protein